MQEYICYFTCQGKQKGPFSLTQLRQMREDGILGEEFFTPEEWTALLEVLDSDELRETSFWRRKPLVRISKPTAPNEGGLKRVLTLLTWVGYCIAAFLIGWSMVRSERGLFFDLPCLLLGALCSIALTRTWVGKLIRRRLTSCARKPSMAQLLNEYFLGLIPLLMIVAMTLGLALQVSPHKAALTRLVYAGGLLLVCGAIGAVRLPASLYQQWRALQLYAGESYSRGWMTLPLLVFVLLLADHYAEQVPFAKAVVTVAKQIVFEQELGAGVDDWQFPIGIGSSKRKVQAVFGAPDRIVGGEHWFAQHGVGVRFNFLGYVTRLRITKPENNANAVPIAWGITTVSGLRELRICLGPPNGTVAFKQHQLCVWSKPPFRISAELWTEDNKQLGAGNGSLKQLEITTLEQSLESRHVPESQIPLLANRVNQDQSPQPVF